MTLADLVERAVKKPLRFNDTTPLLLVLAQLKIAAIEALSALAFEVDAHDGRGVAKLQAQIAAYGEALGVVEQTRALGRSIHDAYGEEERAELAAVMRIPVDQPEQEDREVRGYDT